MPILTLNADNRAELRALLDNGHSVVACLCAAWCDVCKTYQPAFAALANLHPELYWLWIDIEDQADLLGDIDVENFPTLLIQRGAQVHFFGAVLPDAALTQRLVRAQLADNRLQSASAGITLNLRDCL